MLIWIPEHGADKNTDAWARHAIMFNEQAFILIMDAVKSTEQQSCWRKCFF